MSRRRGAKKEDAPEGPYLTSDKQLKLFCDAIQARLQLLATNTRPGCIEALSSFVSSVGDAVGQFEQAWSGPIQIQPVTSGAVGAALPPLDDLVALLDSSTPLELYPTQPSFPVTYPPSSRGTPQPSGEPETQAQPGPSGQGVKKGFESISPYPLTTPSPERKRACGGLGIGKRMPSPLPVPAEVQTEAAKPERTDNLPPQTQGPQGTETPKASNPGVVDRSRYVLTTTGMQLDTPRGTSACGKPTADRLATSMGLKHERPAKN